MIYTLTTNPTIDMNIKTDSFVAGKVNRTEEVIYSPRGKGINVSFVLRHFGVDSGILGFFGGFSGEYILSECEKSGYKVFPVKIEGTNRINVFVETDDQEYNLVNKGPFVSEAEQKDFLEILKNLENPELLIISGSLAEGMDDGYYDEILKICEDNGTKVVFDISSKKLKDLLKYKPLLIKPNDEELEDVFSISIKNEKDAVKALKYLHNEGARNILITMGEKGSYFYDGKDVWFCGTCEVNFKSSVCAGDGFLAAFLSVWLKDPNNVQEALKLASATGADIVENAGIGMLSNVEKYKNKVFARKISE